MVINMEHTQQYETEHLKKVQDKLAAEIKELNAQHGDKQEEIVRMKKYFWENWQLHVKEWNHNIL